MPGIVVTDLLWRRLDVPGHEACRLSEQPWGFQLEGTAVFLEGGSSACLRYDIRCDAGFRSQRAHVTGFHGRRTIDARVEQLAGGGWSLDGEELPQVRNCSDFDLGFSPATNLLQLRRINLREGQAADVPAAWFDLSQSSLSELQQTYRRIARDRYDYTAPTVPYAAVLEVTALGFVSLYPGLWQLEPG